MDTHARFDPLAKILLASYLDAGIFSREFKEDHGIPPTAMCKVHFIRSVIQGRVARTEGLALGSRFAEFGRVEIFDAQTKERFVLRSQNHLAFQYHQPSLFEDEAVGLKSEVMLLIYDFGPDGLALASA